MNLKKETEMLLKKKMTKKAFLKMKKQQRSPVCVGFNTGERVFKNKKDIQFNRKLNKVDLRLV